MGKCNNDCDEYWVVEREGEVGLYYFCWMCAEVSYPKVDPWVATGGEL